MGRGASHQAILPKRVAERNNIANFVFCLCRREGCDQRRRERERLQDFHREVSLVFVAPTPCRYPFIGGSASSSLWPRVRVLLFCANHLFIAAKLGHGLHSSRGAPL
jgi:hypothetical protein